MSILALPIGAEDNTHKDNHNHNPSTRDAVAAEKMSHRRAMAKLRTVLVKVSPAPTTLSERRAILRVLKQRGEVDLFKKLHVRLPNPVNLFRDLCVARGANKTPTRRTRLTSSQPSKARRWPTR